MAKHPGDDGDWNQDAMDQPRMSIKQRVDTQLGVTSPEVIRAMRVEDAFVASVHGKFNTTRFTDRRTPADRKHVTPHGADRSADPRGGAYITQKD